MVLAFDPAVVRVASDASCAKGGGWLSSFECTTNDPVDEVLLVGSCGLSPSSGCKSSGAFEAASVTFTVVGPGLGRIGGEVTKLKDDVVTISGTDIGAGSGFILVTATAAPTKDPTHTPTHNPTPPPTRLPTPPPSPPPTPAPTPPPTPAPTSPPSPPPTPAPTPRPTPAPTHRPHASGARRRLAAERRQSRRRLPHLGSGLECSEVLGDANGDCAFDIEDVQYLQYFIGGAVDAASLSAQQLLAMDPDQDGDSDGVDIAYLMKVVANKFRFLVDFASSPRPFSLTAALAGSDSLPAPTGQTLVAFEFASSRNAAADVVFKVGTDAAATADGVKVNAIAMSSTPGSWEARVHSIVHTESEVGVVVTVTTTDALGATSDERSFAFYCSGTTPACVDVYGAASAFKPYTFVNISSYTMMPTPLPTMTAVPTHDPTAVPTTDDTVLVAVVLELAGADARDLVINEPATVIKSIAALLGIDPLKIKNLLVVRSARRLRDFGCKGGGEECNSDDDDPNRLFPSIPSGPRRVLGSHAPPSSSSSSSSGLGRSLASLPSAVPTSQPTSSAFVITFDIITDLEEYSNTTSFQTATELQTFAQETLAQSIDNGKLAKAIEDLTGLVVDIEIVSASTAMANKCVRNVHELSDAEPPITTRGHFCCTGNVGTFTIRRSVFVFETHRPAFLHNALPFHSYPTLFPTGLPTALPTPSPTAGMCAFEYLDCPTASVTGNNRRFGSFVGNPSPEVTI